MQYESNENLKKIIIGNLEQILDDDPDPDLIAMLLSILDLEGFNSLGQDKYVHDLHPCNQFIH